MKKIISLITLLLVLSALSSTVFAPIVINKQEFINKQTFREQMLQKDKALHFSASFLITTGGFMFGQSNGYNRSDSKMIGVGLGAIVGIGKEIYDTKKKPPTGFSLHDILADSIGIISSIGLIELSK